MHERRVFVVIACVPTLYLLIFDLSLLVDYSFYQTGSTKRKSCSARVKDTSYQRDPVTSIPKNIGWGGKLILKSRGYISFVL